MNKNFIAGIWTLLFIVLGQRLLIKCLVSILTFPSRDPEGVWEYILALISAFLFMLVLIIYCAVIFWIRDQFITRKLGAIIISLSLITFSIIIFLSNYFQGMYRIEMVIINLLSIFVLFSLGELKPETKRKY